MITEKTIYEAECTECREPYVDDGSIYFKDKDKLVGYLVHEGWVVTANNVGGIFCICPDCKDKNK